MAERESYIGGPTGGVPERIFTPGFGDIVEGMSGKSQLLCAVDRKEIAIRDLDTLRKDPDLKVLVDKLSSDSITLNVRTRHETYRHPDLYAAKLVKRGIQYFEEEGESIKNMHVFWPQWSDNYAQFNDYLAGLQKQTVTQEDMEQAAKQTWNGKLADSLGFRHIDYLTNRTGFQRVIFSRDTQ